MSCIAQVCDQFSPFLFRVEELNVSTTQSPSVQDDEAGDRWLGLIRSFNGVKDFRVGEKLTRDIICALGQADGETTLLPSLRLLHVEQPTEMNEPSYDALSSFINSRSLSAPIQVNVSLTQSHQCLACHTSFWQEKAFRHHFKDKHADQILVCSYCADFEWEPGHNNDPFREHLAAEHPHVASHDAFIWSPMLAGLLSPPELENHLKQHSSRRGPPDIIGPSPESPMTTPVYSQ